MSSTTAARSGLNQQTRFIIGTILGFAVSGSALFVFSTILAGSLISDAVLSGFTFLGIGLSVLGYLEHRKGSTSLLSDLVFGFGMGIVVVSFIGAGYGSIALV